MPSKLIDRRTVLTGAAAALGSTTLAACGGDENLPPTPVPEIDRTQPIVDAHAHVFNAKDLPGFAFIHEAYIQRYTGLFLEPLMPLFRSYAGRIEQAAPGFQEEQDAMRQTRPSVPTTALLTETLIEFSEGTLPGAGPPEVQKKTYQDLEQLSPPPPAPPPGAPMPPFAAAAAPPPQRRLAEFLVQPAFAAPAPAPPPGMPFPSAAPAAPQEPPRGPFAPFAGQIRQIFAWFSSFKEYRRERIDAWAKFIGTTGPRFVMPAIVDFGYSLRGVNYTAVPVPQQVQLMGELSRQQPRGRLVHGYVPFNPVRYVLNRAEATTAIDNAVQNQGFIGIKLYPPMGFQASGNDKISMHFFMHIAAGIDNFGGKLNEALNWAYDYCLAHDLTIMVHTAPSNTPHGNPYDGLGAGRDDWSRRPDPKFWDSVLSTRPNLRVLFGHFGGAYSVSKNRAWVDSIVGLMMKYPSVYGDFSDYDLVLDKTQDQRVGRRDLKNYLQRLEQPKREKLQQRLVFGSDWEMLDLVVDIDNYTRNMLGFLAESLGGRVEDYAACNALRMVGLDDPNSKTSQRLLRFHPPNSHNRPTLMTFMRLAGPERVASRT